MGQSGTLNWRKKQHFSYENICSKASRMAAMVAISQVSFACNGEYKNKYENEMFSLPFFVWFLVEFIIHQCFLLSAVLRNLFWTSSYYTSASVNILMLTFICTYSSKNPSFVWEGKVIECDGEENILKKTSEETHETQHPLLFTKMSNANDLIDCRQWTNAKSMK